MNDQKCHIKRQIANLAKRSQLVESRRASCQYKRRESIRKMSVPETRISTPWSEFRRSTPSLCPTKQSFIPSRLQESAPQATKRCKSAFYKRMLSIEDLSNAPLSHKRVSQIKLKPQNTVQKDFKREPYRNFIEAYLHKPFRRVVKSPHSSRNLSSPRSPSAQGIYLEAKMGKIDPKPLFFESNLGLYKI